MRHLSPHGLKASGVQRHPVWGPGMCEDRVV